MFIFLSPRKNIERGKSDGKTYNKCYSLRYIDSASLMNDSVDTLMNNLSNNIQYYSQYQVQTLSEMRGKVEMIALNGVKCVKIVKNCHISVKNVTKYVKAVNFIFKTWKLES